MCLPTDPAIPLKLIYDKETRRNIGKQGHARVLTALLLVSARTTWKWPQCQQE